MRPVDPRFERVLKCTRCRVREIVAELPERFLNPDEFLCADCLTDDVRTEAAPEPVQLRVGE